jgi:hypothetical protein
MAERHQALYRQVIEQHRASAGSTIAERVQAST